MIRIKIYKMKPSRNSSKTKHIHLPTLELFLSTLPNHGISSETTVFHEEENSNEGVLTLTY